MLTPQVKMRELLTTASDMLILTSNQPDDQAVVRLGKSRNMDLQSAFHLAEVTCHSSRIPFESQVDHSPSVLVRLMYGAFGEILLFEHAVLDEEVTPVQ